MLEKDQAVDSFRKKPSQERSTATVAAIFEASARILQQHGGAALNTNAIAELAGISVGTLYHYFPNKDAILIAMAREELGKTSGKIVEGLNPKASALDDDPMRMSVRALLKGFGGRQRMRKVLIETMIGRGLSEELSRPVEAVARAIALKLQAGQKGSAAELPPVRLFVLTRAVIGTIRAAVMEQSPYLNTQALEDELVALVRFYFR
jgi:AcrR family transcriptional regulator